MTSINMDSLERFKIENQVRTNIETNLDKYLNKLMKSVKPFTTTVVRDMNGFYL